jgi:hypothetical protein
MLRPANAHHLRPDQVHRASDDFYTVDGYGNRIPVAQALPSQDGDYWIFYRNGDSGYQSSVYCFFVPMASQARRGSASRDRSRPRDAKDQACRVREHNGYRGDTTAMIVGTASLDH